MTVQLAPNSVLAMLSLDFFDYLRAPDIEPAVVELETRIRSSHPEVSALFVKPQSVLQAAHRLGQGGGPVLADRLFDADRDRAAPQDDVGDG